MRWSGGRDSNSRSPGPKPEAKAYRIRLDLSATDLIGRKSLNSLRHVQPEVANGSRRCNFDTAGLIGYARRHAPRFAMFAKTAMERPGPLVLTIF